MFYLIELLIYIGVHNAEPLSKKTGILLPGPWY